MFGDATLANENESAKVNLDKMLDMAQAKRRLDMFDQRLDNIDSVVTALVERIMKQPLTINMTCPHCGRNIEVSLIGNQKPNSK